MMMYVVLLLAAAIVVVALGLLHLFLPYSFTSRRANRLVDQIPGPKGHPYIGNILFFLGPHEEIVLKIQRLFQEFGPIFKIRVLGINDVFLSSVDDIETLLNSSQHITKSLDYNLLHPWLGTGLLTSTGSKWHTHRKMLTPAFHFKILEEYIPIFNKNTAILLDKLDQHVGEDYIVINKFASLCALDIICETAMGTSVNAQIGGDKKYVNAVQRMGRLFQHRQISPWLWRPVLFSLSPSGREQKEMISVLHGFTRKVIKERRAEYQHNKKNAVIPSRKRLAFLDLLIRVAEEQEDEGVLTDEDIREEVDTFTFEGHDTTSAAISWALFMVGAHHDVQDKVIDELNQIFGDSDRPPTFADLQNMRYLEQVIKESLRLYPSVPGFARLVEVDVNIGGYTIPAGTGITVLPYFIHRDPSLYPDPERFDPERFDPEIYKNRHPFAYLPFSAGPRNCIGQRFALLEEKAVLSSVLRRFKITSLGKTKDIPVLVEMILRPTHGLKLKLSRRC